ncbi:TPA: hypothetical protein DCX66_03475 [Candidatus Nomurabacteria bacterium]|uniref:Extracellular solute-binding protein family 1 n=1 Tax=Candidatus Nomurabacteria bacterium GW2011_GWE1_35_16 TaxID=1618761 RepID=A0A0G0BT96_9BACT|nr:MAG: hypothetical protein UR55_C0001G0055 [Candidatus Nomurabacteria bacterium GW2011_GWF1_34_20]KKP63764.1 MAG: hypothetical protein UR57_C0001G0055 [Candidatus Nomurabacteria bacterium GW2011_GWE2_34_25]KKP66976.1 MAG: hypothetical protein UR64_C0001G0055 [Candidatus Nomurabacteria bacterium GW2011_GWE1_35_16]HAE36798.1 hypothetical protein [Candidatus Nomurabacteria bacterium]HAX65499.1 hypothetical protein [Candidatus Nomurabacteria bacterium]
MNNFQTILVAIFLAFFVVGVLIFSGLIDLDSGPGPDNISGKVVVWGTFPDSFVSTAIGMVDNNDLNINYVKKNASTYQQDLIEAFANGNGPDLFIISPDMIKRNDNFVYKIPYGTLPKESFRNLYIDGADIYLDKEGIIGFPIVVDPIVLYYNKDILANEGIVSPPKSWDELFVLNSALTKRESVGSGVLKQSMIALGQYTNVNNAKDIIATLLLQNSNPIVKRGEGGEGSEGYVSMLNSNVLKSSVSPIEAVLEFFISFSSPSDTSYSWNRSLPNSLDMFTSGKLAFYLGYSSELFNIESINPNLSFNVTEIPQIKNSTTKRTFGEIYAIAVNKKSGNLTSALGVANLLSEGEVAKEVSISSSLPPVSRTLLSDKPTDDNYLFTFFNSALISRSWLDPDKVKTKELFGSLIENILSNKLSMGEAINKAQGQFELLLRK